MKEVQEIYDAYRIPPGLQEHQLRVAAVARTVCEHISAPVDSRVIITACLFHDMGNIIKFDFAVLPELCEPKGVAYWQEVKDEFMATYGTDEHQAMLAIAHEIGLPNTVITVLDGIGFGHLTERLADEYYEKKVTEYGDLRVGPHGVMSVIDRAEDGRRRYRARMQARGVHADNYFDRLLAGAQELESQIFAHCDIGPADITDESIAPMLDELRRHEIA